MNTLPRLQTKRNRAHMSVICTKYYKRRRIGPRISSIVSAQDISDPSRKRRFFAVGTRVSFTQLFSTYYNTNNNNRRKTYKNEFSLHVVTLRNSCDLTNTRCNWYRCCCTTHSEIRALLFTNNQPNRAFSQCNVTKKSSRPNRRRNRDDTHTSQQQRPFAFIRFTEPAISPARIPPKTSFLPPVFSKRRASIGNFDITVFARTILYTFENTEH